MLNGSTDAGTLAEFANGVAGVPNVNRAGNDVSNLASIRAAALEAASQAANLKTYITRAAMVADTAQPVPTTGRVTNDPTASNNGDWVWNGAAWVWSAIQPASVATVNDLVARANSAGIQPWYRTDATTIGLSASAGYTRTVVDGVMRFTPNGITATIGYFQRSFTAPQRFSPVTQTRVAYRMRHFSGNASNRLYALQLVDTNGVSYVYPSATMDGPNTPILDGWVTYIIDISRKPDGSAWGAEVIATAYVALYVATNPAVLDVEWFAVGNTMADFPTNAELERERATLARGISLGDAYQMSSLALEVLGSNPSFWAGLSGFSRMADGQFTRFTPLGVSSALGYTSRTLTTPINPTVNTRLRYKIKAEGGADARGYIVFLQDSTGAGWYYTSNEGMGLQDSSEKAVVYDVDISRRPDGTAWPVGVTITQIWLSLSAGNGATSWLLQWLVVGVPTGISAASMPVDNLKARVAALEAKAPASGSMLRDLLTAMWNPLHSPEILLIGDSITVGVGASGPEKSWAGLFHRWLGESFVDGPVVQSGTDFTYSETAMAVPSNPFSLNEDIGFLIELNGSFSVPAPTYNASAFAYSNFWELSPAGGAGKNKGEMRFTMTGDNLTLRYCAIDAADPTGSIVELWGNGSKLGELDFYGPEAWGKLASFSFAFGRYDIRLVPKSASNVFRLEAIHHARRVKVMNMAVSGSSTGSWLPGSANYTAALAKRSEFAFVQLGTNDRNNPGAQFVTYFFATRIAMALRDAGKKTCLMVSNAVSNAEDARLLFTQRKVAWAIRQVAEDMALDFIDNYQATVPAKLYGETWAPDGLHPNNDGHLLMFESVRERIVRSV
ncbi:SGNH/GDSL hydrolase family protein [Achromobacter kerstersii]|uniref:SGNH/GDSL hydrolase family protein n=1 Tax=Achromobacter kerstersii TaxID=1353890 RepID=UPI001583BBA3|nr:SGNH/GDSL hydrolase family protein [Achromobacter kerstersii]